ncbi:hypothetical protein TsFJ059_000661 [Trichoderma semiorbis]|uniref:J domain-containing protein n=1 Tax=Trichoderma semiorbis TaxID=1491008 RepID=A0A9P8KZ28_9HYPO|nr:hypothetical protein TsFJ059_000661 [Trichoderma semiorbis]KAH0531890.1 hypothetical protein TsFJ059_000661 [Trichoderma semiorbis]KAH0531891.1 hypothetical protein TsFJ059_000661 [Trichoderma semiorbis]
MAPQRDYYADLGLTPTADVAEIKKQFRKLALKYHPDRNPGREQEVNSQFQIIQAAHEVLSDADAKAKYDAAFMRSASRYPAASGVRGNPWQNVSQQFPVPPRRNPPRTTPSGAQRWNERFSAGVPPTAKHPPAATAARAFESMRKGGAKSGQQDRRAPPPPPPPRTESAKKRAEASFGAKRTGYHPRSNTPGDEPPVTNNNYSSRVNPERSEPAPEPAPEPMPESVPVPDIFAQFREKNRSEESFHDPRQSSPYTKSGGEKIDPFDSVPLNRETSTNGPPEPAGSTPKRRSSSMPRKETRDGAQRRRDETGMDGRPRVVPVAPSSRPAASFKARAEAATAAAATASNGNIFTTNQTGESSATDDATQPSFHHTPFNKPQTPVNDPSIFTFNLDDDAFAPDSPGTSRFRKSNSADGINTTFVKDESSATWQFSAGSGNHGPIPQSRSQSTSKSGRRSPIKRRPVPSANVPDIEAQVPPNAAGFDAESWSTKFGPQTFVPRPATPNSSGSPTRLGRANTRKTRTTKPMTGNAAIVDDSSEDDLYKWTGRKTDPKAATVDSPQAMDIDPPSNASPSRSRIPTPPPLVPTAATVASTAASATAPSVNPPVPQSRSQSQPPSQPHPVVARNIPVEPSRPEWRPGNVTGLGQMYEQPEERKEIPVTFKGSEDSEEFRATFEDLKNVAPFAPPKAGLKSFTELKDNLPFESQASAELHIDVPHAHPLVFPEAPIAPKLPPTVAVEGIKPNVASWTKYLEEFESYLRRWDLFNSQVVDHFATRKSNILHARGSKGYSFLGARGDSDILEYHNWLEQDNGVRQRWQAACEEHELRFREFMAFREKMK